MALAGATTRTRRARRRSTCGSFPEPGEKYRVSTSGGPLRSGSKDGQGAGVLSLSQYYRQRPDLRSVDVETKPTFRAGTPRMLSAPPPDLSGLAANGDLVAFPGDGPGRGGRLRPSITVTLNWQGGLGGSSDDRRPPRPYEIVGHVGRRRPGWVKRRCTRGAGQPGSAREGSRIKVLRAEVAGAPERVEAVEREARAAFRPQHPNILTGLPMSAPRRRIPSWSPSCSRGMSAGGADPLRISRLASAVEAGHPDRHTGLAAAHERRHRFHRDLSPGNVFVTKDGVVKILDFGLARLTHLRREPWIGDRPRPRPGLTGAPHGPRHGRLHGTGAGAGLPADHRSDIFSFGCVLYEIAAACERAFRGDSSPEWRRQILKDDILPRCQRASLQRSTKSSARCLEKPSSEERFSSAHDPGAWRWRRTSGCRADSGRGGKCSPPTWRLAARPHDCNCWRRCGAGSRWRAL